MFILMTFDLIFYIRLVVVIVDYILGTIMVAKTVNIEEPLSKKRYFTGLTLFFLTHSTCRLFFLLDDYYFEAIGIQTFTTIGSFLGVLSIFFIVLVIENVIYKKSRYLFTIIGVLGLILDAIDIFLLIGLRYWVQITINIVLILFIGLIYISHIFKSSEIVRKHFLIFTLGISFLALGELGSTTQIITLMPISQIIAPIFMLVGLCFLFYSIIRYYHNKN